MSAPAIPSPVGAPAVPDALAPPGRGWRTMWAIELAKLAAQLKVRIALVACLLGPALFVAALSVQDAVPADTLFGRWVHESGFAVALVVLGFSGQWVLPILIGVVAGDIFAGEDRYRTWTLLLTRSRSRGEVVAGKVLAVATYSLAVVILLALSAIVTGALAVGTQPLVGLSGAMLSSGDAFRAVVLSWATAVPPTMAVAAIAVAASVLSRNSWVGVLLPVLAVLVLNLVSLLSFVDPVRPLLPTAGFDAWHGLVRDVTYTSPVVDSVVVSAGWVAAALVISAISFARRDVVDA